ncbi:hypothetical protein STSP2_01390 [Anaerohalosphaera lusitana]|uniref:Uncharacterized protein n=1 Tax=Anaerohalosphaera lusitana TaxID=1936003 RepID=A0A1U9NKH3_9BACT|nr:HEPN domain-containing protein [Anaerohalosphaera lusitana]AQT68234.1 hypothetical protein STSP2_01390 [Anaerohalosphaera lusitana]
MCDVVALLKNQKLKKQVVATMQSVYSYAGTIHDNYDKDWWEAWQDAEIYGEADKIDHAFEKYVFSKMRSPYNISPREIRDVFEELWMGSPDLETIDFETMYEIFVSRIGHGELSWRRSDPFMIYSFEADDKDEFIDGFLYGSLYARVKKGEDVKLDLNALRNSKEVLWSKNWMQITLEGVNYVPDERKTYGHLLAVLEGTMSALTCQQLKQDLSPVLQSIAKSAALVMPDSNSVPQESDSQSNSSDLEAFLRELISPSSTFPQLKINLKLIVSEAMEAYFAPKPKKDSFEKRLFNAISLLSQADFQQNPAVGLALAITSIEALLGENTGELSEKLSLDVAALLEPSVEKRNAAAKFVKRLYNSRSRVLHGEDSVGQKHLYEEARLLSSSILLSIISRQSFLRRMGIPTKKPKEFLSELRENRFESNLPMGVPELNVRSLWQ